MFKKVNVTTEKYVWEDEPFINSPLGDYENKGSFNGNVGAVFFALTIMAVVYCFGIAATFGLI